MKKIAVIFLFILVAILPFACNKGSNNTATTAGEDSRITSVVKDQISKEPTLANSKIDVDTDNAIVSLKGEVRDPGQEQKAMNVARSVSGVRTVHSFLKVEPESGAGSSGSMQEIGEKTEAAAKTTETAAKDMEITTKVKLELAKDSDVSALDVHVDTLNGVVTLSGNVKNKTEIEEAISDARKIDGVKDVRSELIVKRNS
jgi:osmotically-inducible protein OsmY